MSRLALAGVVLGAWCAVAGANGRPPATSTINFQHGNSQHIAAGMTFGLVLSNDGGQTWSWICEAAFPYSGQFDPTYVYSPSGALFATTFTGLKVMRDGCTFESTSAGSAYMSGVIAGSGSAIIATASSPTDSTIYRSTDDGQTFAPLAMPGLPDDYWESFAIAPSNPQRVYLAGYRLVKECDANSVNAGSACSLNASCTPAGSAAATCSLVKLFLVFRSDDGGATYAPISQANLDVSQSSAIAIAGVDPADPDVVYAHVNFEGSNGGDGLYKSSTAGGSGSADGSAWSKIFDTVDPTGLVVLVRSNSGLVAGTETSGSFATAGGSACTSQASCNWMQLAGAPHINCLSEDPQSKDVWACTQNYGNGSNITSDGAGIMKTSDLATWTKVLAFSQIAAPASCGSDTLQEQQCVAPYMGMPSVWCCLVAQIGITATPIDCTGAYSCYGGADEPVMPPPGKSGCCDTGGGGAGALVLAMICGGFVYRRRRR